MRYTSLPKLLNLPKLIKLKQQIEIKVVCKVFQNVEILMFLKQKIDSE